MINTKNEEVTSLLKSFFGGIPYVGQTLNEAFFDYNTRVKQNRLNKFTELLHSFFGENPDINLETLKTEEFQYVFDNVIKRVVQTRSKEKLKRFRNILINHITKTSLEIDNTETYLTLISELSEIELTILMSHNKNNLGARKKVSAKISEYENLIAQINVRIRNIPLASDSTKVDFLKEFENLEHTRKELEKKKNEETKSLEELDRYKKPEFYNVTQGDFLYSKQKLYSKGLMLDRGIGAMDYIPFQYMEITEFGKKFITFIEGNEI